MQRLTKLVRWHRLSGAADRRSRPSAVTRLLGAQRSRSQAHNSINSSSSSSSSSSSKSGSGGSRSLSTSREGGSKRANGCELGTAAIVSNGNVSEAELQKFRHLEKEWWNPSSGRGAGPLHSMNVTRVQYIVRQVGLMLPEALPHRGSSTPLAGLRALDVGCGGGLLSESLARLGAEVTGIDPSPENIAVASAHALGDPLTRSIRYEASTAEELEARGSCFDLVASLEVIEHVDDHLGFVSALAGLTRPGGMLTLSTINRTPKSFALAIVGAEYLAGLVPVGTHDWKKFVPPEDLAAMLHAQGFPRGGVNTCGLIYNPLSGRWTEKEGDFDVNYIMAALRDEDSA